MILRTDLKSNFLYFYVSTYAEAGMPQLISSLSIAGATTPVQNFKKEFYSPIMAERNNFESWSQKGSNSMEQRANAKWKELLEKYQEPTLSPDADKSLNTYIDSIKK